MIASFHRQRDRERLFWIIAILGFAAALAASVVYFFVPTQKIFDDADELVALLMFCGGLTVLSVLVLVWTYRGRVRISDEGIEVRHTLGTRWIRWDEVTRLEWREQARVTCVSLSTPRGRINVKLHEYSHGDAALLAKLLRERVDPAIQQGWPAVCGPLSDHLWAHVHGPAGEAWPILTAGVLVTRHDIDRRMLIMTLLTLAFMASFAWRLNRPQLLVAVIVPPLLMLPLRWTTPKQGNWTEGLTATFGGFWASVAFLLPFWGMPLLVIALGLDLIDERTHRLLLLVGAIVYLPIFGWIIGFASRREQAAKERRQRRAEAALYTAESRWNAAAALYDARMTPAS